MWPRYRLPLFFILQNNLRLMKKKKAMVEQREITFVFYCSYSVPGSMGAARKSDKLSEFEEQKSSKTLDRENVYVKVGHNI